MIEAEIQVEIRHEEEDLHETKHNFDLVDLYEHDDDGHYSMRDVSTIISSLSPSFFLVRVSRLYLAFCSFELAIWFFLK